MTVFFISLFLFILRLFKKKFKKSSTLIDIKNKTIDSIENKKN